MASLDRRAFLALLLAGCDVGRRTVPVVLRRPTDTPNDLGPVFPPTLTVGTRTQTSIAMTAAPTASTPAVSQYVFQRSSYAGDFFVTVATQSATTFTDTGLSASQTFYYRCAIIFVDGRQSVWSSVLAASTSSSTGPAQRFQGGFAAAMPSQTGATNVGSDSGDYSYTAGADSSHLITISGKDSDGSGTGYSNSGIPGGHTGNVGVFTKNVTGPFYKGKVTAYLTRFPWSSFENPQGTYNFARMDAELAVCNLFGVMYYPCLITKDYNGSYNFNAFPAYIQPYCSKFQNSATDTTGGGMINRWDTTNVQPALALAYKAIGQRYNANAYFGGIMSQETSIGSPVPPASSFTGYSADQYLTALKSEVTAQAQYIPNGRPLIFQNFMNDINNNSGDYKIDQYVQWAQQYGAILCGPDLVLSNSTYNGAPGLTGRVYVRYKPYVSGGTVTRNANGAFAGGSTTFSASGNPTGMSIQHLEWSSGGPGGPTTGAGAPYFMSDNYAYAHGSTATKAPASNVFWYQPSPFNCDLVIFDFPGGQSGSANTTGNPNTNGETFGTLLQSGNLIDATTVPFGPFTP